MSFCTLVLRNFVGEGLPTTDMYLTINYFSYKNDPSIMKTEKTHIVKKKEPPVWVGYTFSIDLKEKDFFEGEILIEIYSKGTFKDYIVGDVHLSINDDLMTVKQLPVSYIPFCTDGNKMAVDSNLIHPLKYGRTKDFKERDGKLQFFFAVTGLNFTQYLLDSNEIYLQALCIENLLDFLQFLSVQSISEDYTEEEFQKDTTGAKEYAVKTLADKLEPLLSRSKKANLILKLLIGYAKKDSGIVERYKKLDKDHKFDIDEYIEENKEYFKKLIRKGSYKVQPIKKREGSIINQLFKK